ncbi:MAG: pyrroline-5-carboxylate reductase [Azonexus sp.]|jgi:pyrroline-5-carboxylate reductase|nr:pyrroline-5-carboxylate reductase [Azonexus sp.]
MKITFIGGGNMANALIGGMLRHGFAAASITVVEPGGSARERLGAAHHVVCLGAASDLASVGDLLLLAVKPQQMREACAPLIGKLAAALVISIAAGLDLATLSRLLGGHRRIIRAMPNTPALIGAGMTGLCALPEVDVAGRAIADQALAAVGSTLWVDDEKQMDGVTALSGSGPAYVFLLIEALQEAAAQLGFTPEQGGQLAIETVAGAAALAARSTEPAAALRERVTSKGGTTEAALRVMMDAGVKEGVIAGVRAAEARSRELGKLLGE